MTGDAHQGSQSDRLGAAVGQQKLQEVRRRRPVRHAAGGTADRQRPLELDVRGFPIARRSATTVQRIARLLSLASGKRRGGGPVPYLNCPACGLRLYSAAAFSTIDACPGCGRTLAGVAARRPSRGSLVRSGGHRLRLTGGPAAPAAARRALAELAVPTQAPREKLELLVSELITNSVKHAPAGPDASLDLRMGVSNSGLRVEVSDDGHGFQPARLGPSRDLTSGWGLYLVDALVDRWGVARDKRTRVWFELRWKSGRPEPRDPTRARRPQLAAARDALSRLGGSAGMRGPRSQRRRRQGRLDESRIQDWLRQLNRD